MPGRSDDAVDALLAIEQAWDIDTPSEPMRQDDKLCRQDPACGALAALSTACSESQLRALEESILQFHADWERRHVEWQLESIRENRWFGWPNHYGLPQYALLLALPEARLSRRAMNRLRGWRDKFGDLQGYRTSRTIECLPVVSPLTGGRARFVSDRDWIAIASRDWGDRANRWREQRDGAYIETDPASFASSLEEAARLNPGRYVRLACRFPKTAEDCYFGSILRVAALHKKPDGVEDDSWEPARVDDVESLFEHISDRNTTGIAIDICRAVAERSSEDWSAETRARIAEFAVRHPNPDTQEWSDGREGRESRRELESVLLNSVRGCALRAVSALLWAHPGLLDWARELCEYAAKDEHPAVRAASLDVAYAIGRHDLDFALQVLGRACADTDDAVLAAYHGPYLIQASWQREPELIPVLERALAGSDEKGAELAAYWATAGCVLEQKYQELAERAERGGVPQKIGVVRALSDLAVNFEEQRTHCLSRLESFLDDPEEDVLDATSRIFYREGFLDLDEAPEFVARFSRSKAFRRQPASLLHKLVDHEGSLLPFVSAIETGAQVLSGELLEATQSMASRHALAGRDIATLMLRLYQQAEKKDDEAIRSRCLDQWDALLKARVGTGHEVVSMLDAEPGAG